MQSGRPIHDYYADIVAFRIFVNEPFPSARRMIAYRAPANGKPDRLAGLMRHQAFVVAGKIVKLRLVDLQEADRAPASSRAPADATARRTMRSARERRSRHRLQAAENFCNCPNLISTQVVSRRFRSRRARAGCGSRSLSASAAQKANSAALLYESIFMRSLIGSILLYGAPDRSNWRATPPMANSYSAWVRCSTAGINALQRMSSCARAWPGQPAGSETSAPVPTGEAILKNHVQRPSRAPAPCGRAGRAAARARRCG